MRRVVGGIYLSFLLPALMGLFAQVGGTDQAQVWRAASVVLAVVGCACTLRLLARARGDRFLIWQQAGAGPPDSRPHRPVRPLACPPTCPA